MGVPYRTNRIRVTETVMPRLSRNEMTDVTSIPGRAIVWLTEGALGGVPVAMDIPFDRTLDEYNELEALDFPEPRGTFRTADLEQPEPAQPPDVRRQIDDLLRDELGDAYEGDQS